MAEIVIISTILLPFLLIALLIWKIKRRRKQEAIDIASGELYKLPLWKTVKESYRLAWKNRAEYFKISWIWLTISAVVTFLYNLIFWKEISAISCISISKVKLEFSTISSSFIVSLVVAMCGASIAVAWHRLILRGERVVSSHYLRLDKVVWNYFALAALILFLETAPQLISPSINNSPAISSSESLMILITSIIYLFIICYSVRIVVMFPAIALELPDVSIKKVLRKTRRNFWGLLFAPLFCSLPLIPFSLLHWFLLKGYAREV
ncbi:MAG: hypothetical protein PQ612_06850 [Rickettsiales bacterium]|nr:hypothetical protein [Pseudomonadota bacterium]MDA0966694.1 hypothetical protein [Pseudomonadota bacterium]MDG4543721.1 hypothetical protein [Rickettsiales bacterium]MDG4545868.1 hypothetical protein [Rickettsiales bacterium]MDG4547357.1 hypothetical protein [Rickettsiales bacterium]